MPLIKRAKTVFLFPNGMIACCGQDGEQIAELQGPYSIDLHKRILLESLDDCDIKGFEILPYSFLESVNRWLSNFKGANLSWEEIKAI